MRNRWPLEQASGEITIRWGGISEAISLGEDGKNHLLFKLRGPDQNQGCRVKSPTSGSYLLVVPDNWDRDEEISGLPPRSSESLSVERYRGHFFDIERGSDKAIAFRTSDGKPISVKSKAAQFKLVGTRLEDASEGVGPLLGKSSENPGFA